MDYLQYLYELMKKFEIVDKVLNLIINGLPSIPFTYNQPSHGLPRFKPYYKWITFNTYLYLHQMSNKLYRFKPYYKWITFNTKRS